MSYIVYVLYSHKDEHTYTGCTKNLRKRILEHNKGMVKSTKKKIPLKLIYAEFFINQADAFQREKFLKTGWGRNFLKKILKNWFKKLGG